MVRLVSLVAVLAALACTPAAPAASWAKHEIRRAVRAGAMAPAPPHFRAGDALTRGELASLLGTLTEKPRTVADPQRPVTVRELDAALVRSLGLGPAAREIERKTKAAGLAPPGRLGTEVVARLLGLRTNHPASEDDLELLPNDTVTRAEAAYSVAAVLDLSDWNVAGAQEAADSLELPAFTPWQQRVLAQAVHFVGYPYVWGGTSEHAEAPFGVPAPGGFDCSGFVWRVYKLTAYPGAAALPAVLRGRTTYEMSGEVGRAKRVREQALEPGDVLFFGSRGPKSKPAQVDHTGIYLGGGWFVHSSGRGVTMLPFAGWYADEFAWARRPLAEAGLS